MIPARRRPHSFTIPRRREWTEPPDVSIVVPLFNEEEGVTSMVTAIARVVEDMTETTEVILVDDGSTDETWAEILKARNRYSTIRGVSLVRNFGHQGALFAGLTHARGRAVITMDGDLQHPPDLIPKLVEAWKSGFRVVNTRRTDSSDVGLWKGWTSKAFYRMFSALSGVPLAPGSADFRLLSADVVESILAMRDPALFLRGAVQWVGCPAAEVPFQAGSRSTGETKYDFRKMLRLAVDGVVSFSSLPLRLGIWAGIITSLLAFAEIGYILIQYFRGNTVPGWASVVTVMSFMFGVLFLLLGVIGTYLAKIYDAIKRRPAFLTAELVGWEADEHEGRE